MQGEALWSSLKDNRKKILAKVNVENNRKGLFFSLKPFVAHFSISSHSNCSKQGVSENLLL